MNLPSPMEDLIRAIDALRERGLDITPTTGNAEIYLKFHWLANTPPPRPANWLQSAKAFNAPNNYPTQLAILASFPEPMPPECRDLLIDLLNAKDNGVMMKACEVAGKSGDKTLLPEILAIIKTENNEWVFRSATTAAAQLGAKRALAEAAVEKLSNEKLTYDALRVLMPLVIDIPNSSGGFSTMTRMETLNMQTAWRNFIAQHGEDIDAGKKHKFGDDGFPRALLGKMTLTHNGQRWPKE